MAYIAQYSPRPGTAAARLEDNVPAEEKKAREEELMEVLRETAYENNKVYKGEQVEVMIERQNKKGKWMGRTHTNKSVKLTDTGNKELSPGGFHPVWISDIQDFGLIGQIKNP